MSTRLLLNFILFQRFLWPSEGWCLYFCPKEKWPETLCAVDVTLGAKLFQGRCQIWRANYCHSADYRVMDMQQCLNQHPKVLLEYLTSQKSIKKFDKQKGPLGVGPWRRFFLLWSLISRLTPRVYTLSPWALLYPTSQMVPFTQSFYYPGFPVS